MLLVTATDIEGSLGYAVWSEDGAAVRRILAKGHDVDDDVWGKGVKTPLMESLDEVEDFYDGDRRAITIVLLEHGADVHRRDESGRTPLHYAASVGAEAVNLFLTAGADMSAQSDDGSTPLHVAVERLSVTAVEALLSAGAVLGLRDRQGRAARELLPQEPRPDNPEEAAIRSLLAGDAS